MSAHDWLKDRLPSERPPTRLVPLDPPKGDEPRGLKARSDRPSSKARRDSQVGPQARLCRRSPCANCGKPPMSDPAHWPSKGANGKDCDALPLCRACHDRQHSHGDQTFAAAFLKRTGLEVEEAVRRMRDRLRDHQCEGWVEQTKKGLRCAICWRKVDERELARP